MHRIRTLEPRADGGYLVERETGTVAYRGASTAQFLGHPRGFDQETEIVVPEGCRATVKVGTELCAFEEPGVLLLAPGTEATVQVLDGEPLILTSERPPAWYRKHKPDASFYGDLARMNQSLTDGRTTLRSA